MHASDIELAGTVGEACGPALPSDDAVRKAVGFMPRPLRFLVVGAFGLIVDLGIFTLLVAHSGQPLLARLVSLGAATVVTWRLNRALTFDRSGRRTADEALRYAATAAAAQGVSYGVFAILVLTVLAPAPQLALLIGSAFAALFSYKGQALFAFRPHGAAP
jgi:putative flippase GtrA